MTDNPKHKDAQARVPLALLPPALLIETAAVYKEGLDNPGRYPFNWRDGGASMLDYLSAAMRHLVAMLDGEDTDPKSGRPHAACVAANMGVILDASRCGALQDDRHRKPTEAGQLLKQISDEYKAKQKPIVVLPETQPAGSAYWAWYEDGLDCGDTTCEAEVCLETRQLRWKSNTPRPII